MTFSICNIKGYTCALRLHTLIPIEGLLLPFDKLGIAYSNRGYHERQRPCIDQQLSWRWMVRLLAFELSFLTSQKKYGSVSEAEPKSLLRFEVTASLALFHDGARQPEMCKSFQ